MSLCRLCGFDFPHVHVSDGVVAGLNKFQKAPKVFRIRYIRNVDFAVHAVQYRGKWYEVSPGFIDRVWPLIRDQVRRLPAASKDEDADQDERHDGDDQ